MSNIIPMKENIYGHLKRLNWLISQLNEGDKLVEFGCGTGSMITMPLAKMGYSIQGIDSDGDSISYGQKLFKQEGLEPDLLKNVDLSASDILPDVIIASEVLEHLSADVLNYILTSFNTKLKPGGKLLVTVPNGYGWFEAESFIWNRLRVGRCLEKCGIVSVIGGLKQLLFGKDIEAIHPSTLSSSPHVQRFTWRSIQNKLKEHGFDILDVQGSVLFCGQFSNLFFTGMKPIMKLNTWLGKKCPRTASAFYIAAVKK
jgi:SAM-dependent methyltransferase